MSAPGGRGHAGCGPGAERRPAWGGQAESGPGRRRRGPEDAQTRPWALQTHRKVGAGKSGSGGVPPPACLRGAGRGAAGGSWSRQHRRRPVALRGGTPERWLGFRCVQANQIFFFFFLRHGSQAGVTVWPQSWGRLEFRGLSRPAPTTVMLLFSEGSDRPGLA